MGPIWPLGPDSVPKTSYICLHKVMLREETRKKRECSEKIETGGQTEY